MNKKIENIGGVTVFGLLYVIIIYVTAAGKRKAPLMGQKYLQFDLSGQKAETNTEG